MRAEVYVISGKTDMRKGIDGLASVVSEQMEKKLFSKEVMFLFCGGKKDRYKVLYWEGDGFALMYKRLEKGKLKWPKETESKVELLSDQQYRWLLEGLSINQPRAVKKVESGDLF